MQTVKAPHFQRSPCALLLSVSLCVCVCVCCRDFVANCFVYTHTRTQPQLPTLAYHGQLRWAATSHQPGQMLSSFVQKCCWRCACPWRPVCSASVYVAFSPVKIFMGSYWSTQARERERAGERASWAILCHLAALWLFSLHTFRGRQLHNIIIQWACPAWGQTKRRQRAWA